MKFSAARGTKGYGVGHGIARKHVELRENTGEDDEAFCRAWDHEVCGSTKRRRDGAAARSVTCRVATCKQYGHVMRGTIVRGTMECVSIERGSVMRCTIS